MKKLNNKLFIWLGAAVIILIVIAVVGKKKGWFGAKDETRVSMAVVEIKTVIETVSANGKIQPETEVKISSDVSGEIRELYVI
jgi:HlyD family secretion protein